MNYIGEGILYSHIKENMKYNLAVQVNPEEDSLPFTMLITNIGNNRFRGVILDEYGLHFCPIMEGDNYDDLKEGGIGFIETELGSVTIVSEVDFIQEDLEYFEDDEY